MSSNVATVKLFVTLPGVGKQDVRRITTSPPLYPAVIKALNEAYEPTYGPQRFVVQYDDGEDLISVGSEAEMAAGLALHASSNPAGSVWKLLVHFDQAPGSAAASGLMSPKDLFASGMSTPSVAAIAQQILDCPPSPSRTSAPAPEVQPSAAAAESDLKPDASTELLGASSIRSDDEPELVDSEDEYERIEVENASSPKIQSPSASMLQAAAEAAAAAEIAAQVAEAAAKLAAAELEAVITVNDAPSQTEPTVSEDCATQASVEVEDVTGHAEFVQPSPDPEPEVFSPVNAASAASASAPVHVGITCDGCQVSPITGVRFHCTVCSMPGGYDLCESCEQAGDKHPASHVLLKMRVPAANTAGRISHCPRRTGAGKCHVGPRPRADFISDVTLADGLQVHAGETLTKVWSIKNSGEEAWPAGTRLVFAGGDLAPESENLSGPHGAVVPYAGPGDIVHVSIDIQVPEAAGRFRGTFRLQTADGLRFGPRIWIDLCVPAAEEQQQQQEQKEEGKQPEAPKEAVVAAPVQEEPKAASAAAAAAPSEPEEPLSESIVLQIKQMDAADELARQATLAAAKAKAAEAAMPVAMPVVPVLAKSGSVERKEQEEASAAEAEAKPKASFQFANELATLRSMGFKDVELCRYLLLNNNGDLEKVCSWLLANATQ